MLRSRLAGVWTAWIAAMLCSFSCLAFRALLGLLVRSRRGPGVKDIEPMTLRHELDVVRHQISRRADRALLAAAACPRRAQPNHCCWSTPRTVLGWHRTPCPPHVAPRQQPARPTAALGGDRGTRAPARTRETMPGHRRIYREPVTLGPRASPTGVRQLLARAQLHPAPRRARPSRRKFLRAQAQSIVAWQAVRCQCQRSWARPLAGAARRPARLSRGHARVPPGPTGTS